MSRKNMSKGESQRVHAKRRAYERYGVSLNREQYESLVFLIKHGRATHILKQSCTRSIFLINSSLGKFLVAYDKSRGNINTFLPKELVDEVERNLDNDDVLIKLFDDEDEVVH